VKKEEKIIWTFIKMVTDCLVKVAMIYHCEKCDFECSVKRDWTRHLSTNKHNEDKNNNEKKAVLYQCKKCSFECSRKFNFDKHLLTRKHKNTPSTPSGVEKNSINVKKFECVCGKEYKHKQNLYVHKNKCTALKEQPEITTNMFMELLKQNSEFQKIIVEQNQEFQKILLEQNNKMIELASHPQTINSNNNTINNNKFNLNVFLNETCKDALNINEFVNSLQISLTDTERVGTEGFVEGISRIFLNGLKQLDIYKRPIHCSDLKREIMHVKDNNIWMKEEEDTPKIVNAVKLIACKNIKSIPEWKKAYPECRDSDSKKSDQYLQILKESLGACDKEKDQESYLKVAKKIAKGTLIPKGICP